jgi:hypothetical protein
MSALQEEGQAVPNATIEMIKELAEHAESAQERMRVASGSIRGLPAPNPPIGEDIRNKLATESYNASTALNTAAKAAGISKNKLHEITKPMLFKRFMDRISGLKGFDGEEEFLGKVHLLQLTPREKEAKIEEYNEETARTLVGPNNLGGGKRRSQSKRRNRKSKSKSKYRKRMTRSK